MYSALLPVVAGVLFFCSAGPGVVRARPIDVFADLDGTWVGTFVGYDGWYRKVGADDNGHAKGNG